MSKKITVIVCEPNEPPRVEQIAADLETLQNIVGGYIDVIHPHPADDDACIILNDEGKIMELPINRPLKDARGTVYDVIVGAFIIAGDAGDAGDDFTDLTPEQIQRYMDEFAAPITEETADIYKPLTVPRCDFVTLDDASRIV